MDATARLKPCPFAEALPLQGANSSGIIQVNCMMAKNSLQPDTPDDARTQFVGADSILFATAHRPWPAPMAPWIMTQRWNDLLFLHYPLAPELVRAVVPEVLTLDTYEHRAWISVVPFWINHMRPPGVPTVPWFSRFD